MEDSPMGESPMVDSPIGDYITELSVCKRYREILFQKVALGYLLHFVQNGSYKNILKTLFCTNMFKIRKLQNKTLYIPP